MHRTFEYRCLPQKGQEKDLGRMLYLTRQLYNAALQERVECYRKTGKGVTLYDQYKSLTAIRAGDADYGSINTCIARGALRRLDRAYKAFYQRGGFPRFKGRNRWRTLDLQTGYQLYLGNGDWSFLTFKGLRGRLRVWKHRPFPPGAVMKEASLTRDGKGWKVAFQLELPDIAPVAASGMIGIDVGISSFLTTDGGETIPNPRLLERKLKALRRAQRSLARKQRGSSNRARQRQVVARLHDRAANARRNFHYQTAAHLVARGKTIIVEDLNIKGLAKGRLARQVHDAAWGAFITRLANKAESAGLRVIKVDPKHTSQMCGGCKAIVKKPLSQRTHACPHCGLSLDRDHNAAVNILNRAGIRPGGAKPAYGLVRPQVLACAST